MVQNICIRLLISTNKIFKVVEAPIPSPLPVQATATNSLTTTETVQIPISTTQTTHISAPAVVPLPSIATTATPTIMATTDVKKYPYRIAIIIKCMLYFMYTFTETSHSQIDNPFKEA